MLKRYRVIAILLVLVLSLVGCKAASSSSVPAQPKDYAKILQESRSAEENEYKEILAIAEDGAVSAPHNPNSMEDTRVSDHLTLLLDVLSIPQSDIKQGALSMSVINVQAYSVLIIKPAEGKEESVMTALESYVEMQKKAFESYLQDQYQVAAASVLRKTDTGEIILVMAPDSVTVADKIETALK